MERHNNLNERFVELDLNFSDFQEEVRTQMAELLEQMGSNTRSVVEIETAEKTVE